MSTAYGRHFEALLAAYDALSASLAAFQDALRQDLEAEEGREGAGGSDEKFPRLATQALRRLGELDEELQTTVLNGLIDAKRMTFYLDQAKRGELI